MLHLTLKDLRLEKNMSIRALGKYARVDHSTISRFEAGKGSVTTVQLDRICTVLSCAIEVKKLERSNQSPLRKETV
jgi:transcriptional regulator with XRE-family HTH domain